MKWLRFALGALVATYMSTVSRAGSPPPAFVAALRAAEANEATPAGEEFDTAVAKHFGETHGNTVAGCAEGAKGGNLEQFNLVMKLDGSGNVIQALVHPETSVAKCLRSAVAHDKYPAPAHSDYWVRIEMTLKP